jgi:hypothetical protein
MLERQMAFLNTFTLLVEAVALPLSKSIDPQIVAALVTASAMLVTGADLNQMIPYQPDPDLALGDHFAYPEG